MHNSRIERIDYHGWPECVRLSNGLAEIVVVPAVSRIMHFSLAGMPNVFWEDPKESGKVQYPDMEKSGKYRNFGGAKIWVAPQKNWNTYSKDWPPHFAVDSAECGCETRDDGTVILTGAPCPSSGVRMMKEIRLDSFSVKLTYTMENISDKNVSWGIWMVCGMKPGGMAFLPSPAGMKTWSRDDKNGIPDNYNWKRCDDMLVLDHANGLDGSKIFCNPPRGWLGYMIEDQTFFITYKADPSVPFPEDEGSSEVWAGKDFIELEHVGKLENLAPGRKTELQESWHLFFGPSEVLSMTDKTAWVREKIEDEHG